MNRLMNLVKVALGTRLQVMYHVVHHLMQALDIPEQVLQHVKYGIIEHAWIEEISILCVNRDKKVIASIVIKIDWQTHAILLKQAGKTLYIDNYEALEQGPALSITEKISLILPKYGEHIHRLCEELAANKLVMYRYRKAVYQDKNLLQQVRQALHTVAYKHLAWDTDMSYTVDTIQPEQLRELGFEIKYPLVGKH